MVRITLDEIVEVINELSSALTRAKEAARVARKVYGDEREVSIQLKYAYEDIKKATKILEMDHWE